MDPAAPRPISPPRPLPEPLAALIAERFRLLADPMRLRILDALRDGPMRIGDLAAAVGASQQNASKHVLLLATHGIVDRRRVGTSTVCEIADPTVFDLCEVVCGGAMRHLDALRAHLDPGATA